MAFALSNIASDRVVKTGSGGQSGRIDPDRVVHPEIDYDTPYDSYGEAMEALEVSIAEARDAGNRRWEYGGITVERDQQFFISNIVTSRLRDAIWWSRDTLDAISSNSQIVALHHNHPSGRGIILGEFSDSDISAFTVFRNDYGERFRAVYMMDRRGTRRYDGTTNERGVLCSEGIASC